MYFCGTVGPETPVRHLLSAIRRMSEVYKRRLIPVLQKGETVAVSNKEKADMYVDSFQAVHKSERMGAERCRKRSELMIVNQWKLGRSLENDNPINLFFTIKELKDAIVSGANTTPGRDRLSYEFFKHLDDIALDEIFNLQQGSVISPVLFDIVVNDVFAKIERGFGLSLFADDGATWKRGRNVDFVLKQIQRALLFIEEWGNTWGFKISASKVKYVVFGFKRKLPNGLKLPKGCIYMGFYWRR